MEVIVRGKNLEITEPIRSHVTKKLAKLERFFKRILDATVHFYSERGRAKVEVTMTASGVVLRGEGEGPDWRTAFDEVLEKLERQIKRYKEKLERKGLLKKEELVALEEGEREEKSTIANRVVKTKEFVLRPMSLEDAILQMELLGHTFFVYKDLDKDKVQVVYKRKDGNYGLIDLVY
ncbi:MAG: ribosome hibernation-promoting factor, HPF/YfiA family [Candidatus Caldatribacteriaceae bacterium]